jgi:signal transduction histidine kinase/CheY-like chemotaxis protein
MVSLALAASLGSAVLLQSGTDSLDLAGRLEILEDAGKEWSLAQVRTSPIAGRFRPGSGQTPNHGFTSSAFWYRVRLRGTSRERVYLEMPYVVLDRLEVFVESSDGDGEFRRYLMGDAIPGGGRVIDLNDYVIPVELRPGRWTWLYLRAETEGSLQLPLTLWRSDSLFSAVSGRLMFYFPIFGLLLVLLVYNLILFAMFREASYAYLSLCVVGAGLYLAYFTGIAQAHVFTQSAWLANKGYPLAMTATHLPMWLFTRRFLELPRQLPRVDRLFILLAIVSLLVVPMLFLASYRATLFLVIATVVSGAVLSMSVGVYMFLRRYRPARYYVAGWSLFLVGIMVFAVEKAGVLPTTLLTDNIHVVGYMATLLVLPLGLADRINVLRQEKAEAQARALQVQADMSAHLEQEVTRKTADLQVANEQLAERNEQLQREIEQRERTEKERVELEHSLFQSQKMDAIGRLAGGVAHDMNNILGTISLTAHGLKLELPDDEEAQTALDDMLAAAKRGGELAKNLLGFARRGRFQKERMSLNVAIDEIYRLLRRTIHQGVEIHMELSSDLAAIEADPQHIGQILVNLAVNAAHAMSDKGVLTFHTENVRVEAGEIEGLAPGNYVRLDVSDTGVGMDEATQARVFEPFYTTKAPGQGTGLGLSMVYGAVEAHGGRVTIDSTPGRGATFRILLPALEARAARAPRRRAKTPPRRRPAPATPSGAILIVDDEPTLRKSTSRLLRCLGYEVLEAEHGRQALEIFEREQQRVVSVLLDLVMPVMDGPETFRRLRERDPEVKVIVSSGFSEEGDAGRLLAAGAAGFLQKPYELTDLERMLGKVLG